MSESGLQDESCEREKSLVPDCKTLAYLKGFENERKNKFIYPKCRSKKLGSIRQCELQRTDNVILVPTKSLP